jgi:hypothetical protein
LTKQAFDIYQPFIVALIKQAFNLIFYNHFTFLITKQYLTVISHLTCVLIKTTLNIYQRFWSFFDQAALKRFKIFDKNNFKKEFTAQNIELWARSGLNKRAKYQVNY